MTINIWLCKIYVKLFLHINKFKFRFNNSLFCINYNFNLVIFKKNFIIKKAIIIYIYSIILILKFRLSRVFKLAIYNWIKNHIISLL